MKKIIFVFLITMLAGCSALGIDMGGDKKSESSQATNNKSNESIKKGSGQPIAVDCSGFLGWETCNSRAAKTCPQGYDVTKRDEDAVSQRRTMSITCH